MLCYFITIQGYGIKPRRKIPGFSHEESSRLFWQFIANCLSRRDEWKGPESCETSTRQPLSRAARPSRERHPHRFWIHKSQHQSRWCWLR